MNESVNSADENEQKLHSNVTSRNGHVLSLYLCIRMWEKRPPVTGSKFTDLIVRCGLVLTYIVRLVKSLASSLLEHNIHFSFSFLTTCRCYDIRLSLCVVSANQWCAPCVSQFHWSSVQRGDSRTGWTRRKFTLREALSETDCVSQPFLSPHEYWQHFLGKNHTDMCENWWPVDEISDKSTVHWCYDKS